MRVVGESEGGERGWLSRVVVVVARVVVVVARVVVARVVVAREVVAREEAREVEARKVAWRGARSQRSRGKARTSHRHKRMKRPSA